MNPGSDAAYIAFEGDRCIASGDLRRVARAAKETLDRRNDASILIFDGATSGPVEIDFRGTVADVLARLPEIAGAPVAPEDAAIPASRVCRIILPPRSPRVAPWRRPRSEGGVQPGRDTQSRQRGSASRPSVKLPVPRELKRDA